MKKRFTEEQIIGLLKEADAGMPVKDLCRRHGFSEASYSLPIRTPTSNPSNGRFCDDCLNEQWFTSLLHSKAVIRAWTREHNEERPKQGLGWLTPAAYAKQLANKATTITPRALNSTATRRGGRR